MNTGRAAKWLRSGGSCYSWPRAPCRQRTTSCWEKPASVGPALSVSRAEGQSGKLWRIAETQLQETVQTGAAWLRRRRQDSTAAATAMARVLDAALSPAAAATDQAVEASALAAWTERHEKEACFQRAAHAKRQCAAVQEGVLPMEALGPEATQQMANFQEQEQTRQRNLDSRQQLLAKKRARRHRPPTSTAPGFLCTRRQWLS